MHSNTFLKGNRTQINHCKFCEMPEILLGNIYSKVNEHLQI